MSHLLIFFSPLGLLALAVLDGTPFFFGPLAVDVVLVVLSARHPDPVWLYPLLATAGSLAGSAVSFWLGQRLGEEGLARFAAQRHLDRLMRRVRRRGAAALAAMALVPPPFPFTLLVLTCGAIGVSAWRFFSTLAAARLLRYGVLVLLALRHGEQIVSRVESPMVKVVTSMLVASMVAGTALSLHRLVRRPIRRR